MRAGDGNNNDDDSNSHGRICNTAGKGTNSDYHFGFLHIKAVDDASHDKDLSLKVHFIQKADEMVHTIVNKLVVEYSSQFNTGDDGARRDMKDQGDVNVDNVVTEYTIVVTGDHSTPTLTGTWTHLHMHTYFSHAHTYACM